LKLKAELVVMVTQVLEVLEMAVAVEEVMVALL
jgi:hypothetical protein